MAYLYLVAEGRTELTFADTVLDRHLHAHSVFMHPSSLVVHARRQGRLHRGGGRTYAPIRDEIRRRLGHIKVDHTYLTTMIDLYALPTDFPGQADAEKVRHLPAKRVEALERAFFEDIGDPRFLPYIQLHEFEAYLLSDPAWFEYFYPTEKKAITALQVLADGYPSPEQIDDGPHTAPSKRIIAQLPDYAGAKATLGPQITALIGLPTIRAKCPHFHAWLTRLERLADGPQS